MQPLTEELVHRINRIVRDCGQSAKHLAGQGFEVYQKGPGDYVTDVDRALDEQLTQAFDQLFPDDKLVTEENSASLQGFHDRTQRIWCVDPLDGTQDFINGDPDYAVMVGALGREPLAGWIYAPEYDALYFGGPGIGLWQRKGELEPCPLTPSPTEHSQRWIIGYKDLQNYGSIIQAQLPKVEFWQRPGSFGLKVLEVVQGQAGAYIYLNQRVKVWDTVAPLAIAQAAGLQCCDLQGQAIGYAPDQIHPETLAHLQPIVIGWPTVVQALLPALALAIHAAVVP
ncbi:inositol monophosphatase family protein [Alkalinema sp. FACHB-956]|uniref:3'(2'),5'-bisphosphate nucleotidase CysQ family protein n=1 Tax=Alkalinema sp. FACHB-956 TaxID=2692768 RepID=UPI001685AF19|nr:inositol monophosphatase family protein [Alkalinema sp. FACHB-956]MBD2325549.1 inositol monophosphatase family protein [Alkalinema sp. FACHB-956]